MTDEAALLAAIAAHPAEDTPRLAYADWLDEHGDAAARVRAELIRVQCEAHNLERRPPADLTPHVPLYRRQHDILEDHRRDLLGSLADETSHLETVFERGFLAELTLEADVFLRHADTIAGYKPLPELTILGVGPHLGGLAARPHHAALIAVCRMASDRNPVPFTLTPSEVRTIFAEDWPWHRLRALGLEGCDIGDDGLAELAHAVPARLPALTELDVSVNEISDDGVQLLVSSPLWPRLKRLVLGVNPISDVGAVTLANAAATSRLENLNLRFIGFGLDAVRELSRAYGGRADVF
jgi:uncharacterized protein (TIGR02996 family)